MNAPARRVEFDDGTTEVSDGLPENDGPDLDYIRKKYAKGEVLTSLEISELRADLDKLESEAKEAETKKWDELEAKAKELGLRFERPTAKTTSRDTPAYNIDITVDGKPYTVKSKGQFKEDFQKAVFKALGKSDPKDVTRSVVFGDKAKNIPQHSKVKIIKEYK